MVAKNHIITGIASVTILYSLDYYVYHIMDCYNYVYLSVVHNYVYNFITKTPNIPLVIWCSICFVLFLLGLLLPDADSSTSIIGRYIHIPVQHRTWTHAIWFPMFVLIVSIWVRCLYWLSLGYMLHLFWDNFSVMGVCYIYPLSKYRHYGAHAKIKKNHIFKLYRTNDISENVITGLCVIICIIIVVFVLYSYIINR